MQGCDTALIPDDLTPAAAQAAEFEGMVFHSIDFGAKMDDLLASVPQADQGDSQPSPIVVIGGGKSAQE